MEPAIFYAALVSEGVSEIVKMKPAANGFLGRHAHPLDAKSSMRNGEIILQIASCEPCYQVGQVFHLLPDQRYGERDGVAGGRYRIGRK